MTSATGTLNIREAAAFLGAHEQTVRKLARLGSIPAFKVGRDWRFLKGAIQKWAEAFHGTETMRRSVLVVDDDEMVRRSMDRILRMIGCRVLHAASGYEGLRMVREGTANLVLLDLIMPDINGVQFQALRETHPELPVVLVTGYPDSNLMNQAIQYAPVMLLAKPVEPTLLERTVRSLLGERQERAVAGI